jgi:hypothetical protein
MTLKKKKLKIKIIYILNNPLGSTVIDFLVDANGQISCSGKIRILVNEAMKDQSFFYFFLFFTTRSISSLQL